MSHPPTSAARVLVDAHVHVHPCFDPEAALDAALDHFRRWAGERRDGGVLMLAEPASPDAFRQLRAEDWSRWRLEETGEAISRMARRGEDALLLVAGFQVPSAEGLEVLALGSTGRPRDGAPLGELLAQARSTGGLGVVPWGAGKWLGRRGRLLRGTLESAAPGDLFLGDNGGRPGWWRDRAWFRRAAEHGIGVLPGSDPLPFAGEEARIGGHGFSLEGPLAAAAPAADLLRRLRAPGAHPEAFGVPESTPRFFRNQLAMQWRMRLGAR